MSIKQIRYAANVLLLLYIGYFGCVSYFVHKHVYDGVIYIHSHPYKKVKEETNKDKEPPFETHKHTSAGFFTINQLSNYTSYEAENSALIARVDNSITIQYIEACVDSIDCPRKVFFRHRAPPAINHLFI